MADAFRGLTIKIGADTSQLSAALASISRKASDAQRQMNLMNKALKFNPNNVDAMRARLSLMGDKITLTARSSQTLRVSLAQVAQETKDLASGTRNVYAAAQKARVEYNRVDKELEMIYDAAIKAAQVDLGMGPKEAKKHVQSLQKDLSKTGDVAASAAHELHKLFTSASVKGDLGATFGIKQITGQGWELIRLYHNLRSEQKKTQASLESMNKVEGFTAAKVNLIAFEAELRQAVAETVRFKSELYAANAVNGLAKMRSSLDKVDGAIEKARASMHSMSEVYASLPVSAEALKAKMTAAANEEELLNNKLKLLRDSLRKIESAPGFDKLSAQTKNVYADVARAEAEYDKWEYKLARVTARAEELEQELKDMARVPANQGTSEFERKRAEAEKAAAAVDKVRAKTNEADAALKKAHLPAEWRRTKEAILSVEAEIERLKTKTSKWNAFAGWARQIRTMGYGLYSTLTPAITIAGRYILQSANDIDAAYRNMRKTVNGTEEQFKNLKQAALEFSTTHFTNAATILEIEAMGGQLGIAAQNLESFAEVASSLEVATDIEAEDIAKYIGQLSNIMDDIRIHKDDPAEYQKTITSFADALVRLGNNSAAQESSIMKVMMRIASLGSISGFTTPQLLAIADAVAATGQGCEAAGTAISKTFSNIETAVAVGGEKLLAFADVADMTAEEFAESWRKNPIEAFTAFIGGLKQIKDTGGSVEKTLIDLGIGSVRQKQTLEGLTQTYDVLIRALGMSQDAWDGMSTRMADGSVEEAGDAAREAARKAEGLSGQIQKMKNQFDLLAEAASSGAVPFIEGLSNAFAGLATAVAAMPDGLKSFFVGVAGFFAMLGPASVGLGATVTGLDALGKAFVAIATVAKRKTLADAFGSIGESMFFAGVKAEQTGSKIGKLLGALSNVSVGAAVLGIGAIIGVFATLAHAYDEARKKQEQFDKATSGLMDVAMGFKGSSDIIATGIGNVSTVAGESVKNLGKAREETQKLIEKNVELYDSFTSRKRDTDASIALVQKYTDTIVELANKSDKSRGDLALLKETIAKYNDLTGSNFNADNFTESMDNQTEAIERNTEAYKLNAYVKAYSDIYADAVKQAEATRMAMEGHVDELAAVNQQIKELEQNGKAFTKEWKLVGDEMKLVDVPTEEYANLAARQSELHESLQTDRALWEAQEVAANRARDALYDVTEAQDGASRSAKRLSVSQTDYIKGLETADVDMDKFYELATNISGSVSNFVGDLNEAGITVESFGRIGSQGFDTVYEAAGGSFENAKKLIDLLAEASLDPHEITITENGFEDVNGKLWTLNLEAGTLTDGEHVFKLTVGGVQETTEALNEAAQAAENVTEEAYETDMEYGDVKDATAATEELDQTLEGLPSSTTVTVDYAGNAYSYISNMKSMLSDMTSKTWDVEVNHSSGGNAAGGISRSILRSIPKNAIGGALNGIVTRATLTNMGWVGEAGDEAVLHMRNAGGAIIPLSNRQHVRPFARSVAAEMRSYNSSHNSTVVNNYSIDGMTVPADSALARAMGKVFEEARGELTMMGVTA